MIEQYFDSESRNLKGDFGEIISASFGFEKRGCKGCGWDCGVVDCSVCTGVILCGKCYSEQLANEISK